jgi:hypothetical protein
VKKDRPRKQEMFRKLLDDDTAVLEGVAMKMAEQIRNISRGNPEWRYHSKEDMVLAEGLKMTEAYPAIDVVQMLPQRCYANAAFVVDSYLEHGKKAVYCEGLALTDVEGLEFPVWHAWVIIHGKVYDPTWTGEEGTPTGKAYIGIPFDQKYVHEFTARYACASMIDAWEQKYPLLSRTPGQYRHPSYPLKETVNAG